jgi:uncharacterized membrane protein YkoI
MIKKYASLLMLILLFSHFSLAHEEFDVKELKEMGKISSLEIILEKLSDYNIDRLLEVELKQKNNQYIYELEYINDKGIVLEIEVDAVTAQVLEIEYEH